MVVQKTLICKCIQAWAGAPIINVSPNIGVLISLHCL